jgi:hypothetical protein
MFSGSINDTSRNVRMMIIGDATTWNITSDHSRVVIYISNIFVIQATYLGGGEQTNNNTFPPD